MLIHLLPCMDVQACNMHVFEGLWLVMWQEDAIRSTRAVLEDEVDPAQLPRLEVVRTCHSSMKVGDVRIQRLRSPLPHQLAAGLYIPTI